MRTTRGTGTFRFALIAVAGITLPIFLLAPSTAQEPLMEVEEVHEAIMDIAISPSGEVALGEGC
jgi:hypothetical protein